MASSEFMNDLLSKFTVADNTVRTAAEQQYEALKKGDQCVIIPLSLLQSIGDHALAPHLRQLAAVLLRRMLIEDCDGIYSKMDPLAQEGLRSGLLETLRIESNPSLKSNICNIVGEFASIVLEPSDWPEILVFAYISVQSTDPLDRETGLSLFGMVSSFIIDSISQAASNADVIIQIFQCSLVDEGNGRRVMLSAIRALTNILLNLSQESDMAVFYCLTGPILNGLQIAVNATIADPTELLSVAYSESLIDIAESCQFFTAELATVFEVVMSMTERDTVLPSLRHMLVELLVNICCNSPKRTRKLKSPTGERGYFACRFIPMAVRMMLRVTDDDPHWATVDSIDDMQSSSEGTSDYDVGETALDRVTQSLGLRATYGIMTSQLMALFSEPTAWQYHYAGLHCMGNYLEVSATIPDKAQLQQHREEIVNIIIGFSNNAHPRVRAAAFYAASQFFVMHGKTLKVSLIERMLSMLLQSSYWAVNPSPRVRRSVILALVHLIDSAPSSALEQHTKSILDSIVSSLSDGSIIVQELCVQTIISVTENFSADAVKPYYDSLMPILKQLLQYAQSHNLEALWGQGLECCARLGEASGKIKFYPDALEMMGTLVQVQNSVEESSDVRKYLMKAWVRIARCLEAEFLPFLPLVMEKLLAAITQDLSAGTGDIDLDDIDNRSDIEMIETEDGWKAVRTAAVEEQASACQLLVLIVERLQEHFYPYVEQSTRALAPLISSPHEDVRSYAMVSMGEFVRAAAKSTVDRAAVGGLSEYCLGLIIEAIPKEDVLDLIMTALQSIKQVLFYLCTNWSRPEVKAMGMQEPPSPLPATSIPSLNEAQMVAITQCCMQVLRDSLQRRAVLRAETSVAGGNDEEDADDERAMMGDALELNFNVSEVIGSIMKTHGPLYYPVYISQLHECISEMSNPHCLREDRQFAFYVISDVVEYGITEATCPAYFAQVLPVVCEACANVAEANVRQACAYILGIAAETCPVYFSATHSMQALQALAACVARGEDETEARGQCTDNAVSAVGTILQCLEANDFKGLSQAQYEALWSQWIDYLPLKHDEEESRKVIGQLCKLVEKRHANLFAGGAKLSQIIFVLLEVFNTEFSTSEQSIAISQILQSMNIQYTGSRMPGASMAAASSGHHDFLRQVVFPVRPDLMPALEAALSSRSSSERHSTGASSPLATAPIHDVLLRR